MTTRSGTTRTLLLALTAGAWSLACAGPVAESAAEDDHTHAGGGVVTHWTDAIELFVEYPPHVRDVPSDPWAIHLTWLADWTPVREGRLTLLLRGPGGAREEIVLDGPSRPGVFTATPALTATGTWRADMTLTARGRDHEIPVGQLQVFDSEDALPHDEEENAPADLIPFLKEQQWTIPFAIGVVEERDIPRSVRATGEITAPPGGLAYVSAPVSGLVLTGGPALAPGERVAAGQTLALIAPTDLESSYARLRSDVIELQREVERAERLLEAGAIAERRLIEARHDLETAQAAFQAVGGGDPSGESAPADPYTYRLRAPIGGVVSDRRVAPGQRVAVGEHAFTIVNPAILWFRARVPANRAEDVAGVRGAWFTVEGGSRAYPADRLVAVGSIIDPLSRTLPVDFSVANPDGSLKVGMLADGRLLVGESVSGTAVPTAAIQDEDGLPVVYVKLGGEAFQRRVVQLGPSDGTWTIVVSGVAAGEQVVTEGAYQVRLASLGDAEISDHGHPH